MSGDSQVRWSRRIVSGAPGSRVTRLELFYDVVFVFAFFNISTLAAERLAGPGLLEGLVVLLLLWRCWVGFVTLGNVVRADQGAVPLVGFFTMAGVFVLALSVAPAFRGPERGLSGPVIFAASYFLVRVMQVLVFGWLVRDAPRLFARWLLLAVPVLLATGLILTAALGVPWLAVGSEAVARRLLLCIAIAVEFGADLLLGRAGVTVVSAGHWAERHALIVLVALGESVLSLGVGPNLTAGLPLTWPVMLLAVLGIAVIFALWWMYFDSLALALEQALHRTRDRKTRVTLARDAYTYLHLPLVAGVILFALGLKRLLSDHATPGHRLAEPSGVDVVVLYGGVLLYAAALVAMSLRALRRIRWRSLIVVGLLAAMLPVAPWLPGLAALAVLATISGALTVVQVLPATYSRRVVREIAMGEQLAAEADQTEWRRRHL